MHLPIMFVFSFFYEREGQFTPDQLVQIKQSSLSRLICDNADGIIRVPVHALKLQNTSEFVPCAVLPTVDLFLWKDCNGKSMTIIVLSFYKIGGFRLSGW